MKGKSNCDFCVNYVYDEDYQCYQCEVNLDEDELAKFMRFSYNDCPHFKINDEYQTVRKQI